MDVFRGAARFVSPREVEVGGRRLRARNFVIATGSRAALPPIEGLAEARPFTNETIFDELRARPAADDRAGRRARSAASWARRSRASACGVTIVEARRALLDKEDADAAAVVRRAARGGRRTVAHRRAGAAGGARDGRVRTRAASSSGDETLEAEALLVAAGRRPERGRPRAWRRPGVAHDEKGVTVDAHLQTSQPHIYAAGDVTGGPQFTHLADHHARTVVRNILMPWLKSKTDTRVLPWCTYTAPEVARVGLSEAEARQAGHRARRVGAAPGRGGPRGAGERGGRLRQGAHRGGQRPHPRRDGRAPSARATSSTSSWWR